MSKSNNISLSVIRRLTRYYRFLLDLKNNNVTRVSSRELSERMGITASQIRQDLNCFGGFGQQGYGYSVEQLFNEISSILGLDSEYPTILIGAGNLGRAVATHVSFKQRGFKLIGIFDKNPQITGTVIRGINVSSSEYLLDFCKENNPKVAILCLPRESVEEIAESLINKAGIHCFWNFSHYDLSLKYDNIIMENVHMSDSLMTLSYRITESEIKK